LGREVKSNENLPLSNISLGLPGAAKAAAASQARSAAKLQ
jgi:hypothetical protein